MAANPHSIADDLIVAGNRDEDIGSYVAARAKYEQACRIAPTYDRAWINLGIVLSLVGESEASIDAYRRAIAITPENAPAHYNLGLALSRRGSATAAIDALTAATRFRQHFPDAFAALASELEGLSRTNEALDALRTACRQAPEHVGYATNLGLLLIKLGRFDEAEDVFRAAINSGTQGAGISHGLATVFRETRRAEEACRILEDLIAQGKSDHEARCGLLFTLLFCNDISPDALYRKQVEIGDATGRMFPAIVRTGQVNRRSSRLRIGYVSGDFRRHAVAFFALPVMEKHDRTRFEVVCYSNTNQPDDVTDRFIRRVDLWRDIRRLDTASASRVIEADGVDILVDLAGHTAGNRLDVFATKPATRQATWLGYLGSTGLKSIDYRLCDRFTDPLDPAQAHHTETLLHLPHSQWCYRPYVVVPCSTVLPAIRNGYPTFGSFNQFGKISAEIVAIWSRVLQRCPRARLLVVGVPQGKSRQQLLDSFSEQGIDTSRLKLIERVSVQRYYALFNDVDVVLDTTPYAGGTTTCDALWMSVPVVTLAGDRSASRSGVSVLTAAGLPELIGADAENYVRIAAQLASDTDQLVRWRCELRAQVSASVLMDERAFVHALEGLYEAMLRN